MYLHYQMIVAFVNKDGAQHCDMSSEQSRAVYVGTSFKIIKKKMIKICEDDFYASSADPDCFGDYEVSNDKS